MGKLVKLTVYKRNTLFLSDAEMVFNVDDIISPIRLNAAGKSYFTAKQKNSTDLIDYQVEETLATIKALSEFLLILTVNSRAGRVLSVSESFIFDINKMNEVSAIDTGAGFLNIEQGDPSPVAYIVDEDLDDIITQETTPPAPVQAANKVLAGPITGAAALPTFRLLEQEDIPGADQKTGLAVDFKTENVYGTSASPEAGAAITSSYVGAKRSQTIMIIHNAGAEPTYPAAFQVISGTYVNSVNNYIMCMFLDTTMVLYSISQTP